MWLSGLMESCSGASGPAEKSEGQLCEVSVDSSVVKVEVARCESSTSPTSSMDLCVEVEPPAREFLTEESDVRRRMRARIIAMTERIIRAYVNVYQEGRFHLRSVGSSMYYSDEDYHSIVGYGMQDPQGVLTSTIILLRCTYPPEWLEETTHLEYLESSLCTALLMLVFQNACALSNPSWLSKELARHIFPVGVPFCGIKGLAALKGRMLTGDRPLFRIMNETPLHLAEEELWRFLQKGKIRSQEDAYVLRGMMGLFTLSALLNPDADVFEKMRRRATVNEIAKSLVNVCLTCLAASRQVMFRCGYPRRIDELARDFLEEALAPHSKALQFGPYKRGGKAPKSTSAEVWAAVSHQSLMCASVVFSECEL